MGKEIGRVSIHHLFARLCVMCVRDSVGFTIILIFAFLMLSVDIKILSALLWQLNLSIYLAGLLSFLVDLYFINVPPKCSSPEVQI